MSKKNIITQSLIIILLVLLIMQVVRNDKLEKYFEQENRNSIASMLSNIENVNKLLSRYDETDEITYSELNSIGLNYLMARNEIIELKHQYSFFISKEVKSKVLLNYIDGVSMFISMDMFKGIGLQFPYEMNKNKYFLTDEEKVILKHIFDLNKLYIEMLDKEGVLVNHDNLEHTIKTDNKYNGLDVFNSLVEKLGIVTSEYYKNQLTDQSHELVNKFLERIDCDWY